MFTVSELLKTLEDKQIVDIRDYEGSELLRSEATKAREVGRALGSLWVVDIQLEVNPRRPLSIIRIRTAYDLC